MFGIEYSHIMYLIIDMQQHFKSELNLHNQSILDEFAEKFIIKFDVLIETLVSLWAADISVGRRVEKIKYQHLWNIAMKGWA